MRALALVPRKRLGDQTAICVTEEFWFIVTPRIVKMSRRSSTPPTRMPAERLVRGIRRATRKHHSAEGNIRIVMEGLGSEESVQNIGK
jgi:hypothetical protein